MPPATIHDIFKHITQSYLFSLLQDPGPSLRVSVGTLEETSPPAADGLNVAAGVRLCSRLVQDAASARAVFRVRSAAAAEVCLRARLAEEQAGADLVAAGVAQCEPSDACSPPSAPAYALPAACGLQPALCPAPQGDGALRCHLASLVRGLRRLRACAPRIRRRRRRRRRCRAEAPRRRRTPQAAHGHGGSPRALRFRFVVTVC